MCQIKAGNGNGMIRARNQHAKQREGDCSKAFKDRVEKERNTPKQQREANRRTRARRALRRAAQQVRATQKHIQAAGEAGLEKLINFFKQKREGAA